jgi:hypothetical protein
MSPASCSLELRTTMQRMSTSEVTRIASAITEILERGAALKLRREATAQLEALGLDLLLCLDGGTDAWETTRDGVGQQIAAQLTDATGVAQALELLSVLDDVQVASHPRGAPSTRGVSRNGDTGQQVSTALSFSVLRAFLGHVDAEQRVTFYKGLRAAGPWRAASLCLEQRATSAEEVVVFCHYQQETKGSSIGAIADGLAAWAQRYPAVALNLVERRLNREGTFAVASPRLIQVIVVALARVGGVAGAAREQIVQRLFGEFGDEPRTVAAAIECSAWPASTPVDERHAAVLERLRMSPAVAVYAMQAIAPDAYNHGTNTMVSAAKVLHLAAAAGAPASVRVELIAHAAEIAAMACHRGSAAVELTAIERLLPYFLEIAPSSGERGLGLDGLLSSLLVDQHGLVRRFLESWFGCQTALIRAAQKPLQRLLPQVSYRLGPVREVAWLVKLLCHPHPAVRSASATLLGADDRPLGVAAFNDVRADGAIALAHELAGQRALANRGVEMLFALARARPNTLGAITTIIVEDLIAELPGLCRAQLVIWDLPAAATATSVRQRFGDAKRAVERRLNEREAAHEAKVAIPELATIAPTLAQWHQVEQRAMDRARHQGFQDSWAARFATNITICRGSSTSAMGGAPTPLQLFSFSQERPFVSLVDPIGASERQVAALVRAEALRSEAVPK